MFHEATGCLLLTCCPFQKHHKLIIPKPNNRLKIIRKNFLALKLVLRQI